MIFMFKEKLWQYQPQLLEIFAHHGGIKRISDNFSPVLFLSKMKSVQDM